MSLHDEGIHILDSGAEPEVVFVKDGNTARIRVTDVLAWVAEHRPELVREPRGMRFLLSQERDSPEAELEYLPCETMADAVRCAESMARNDSAHVYSATVFAVAEEVEIDVKAIEKGKSDTKKARMAEEDQARGLAERDRLIAKFGPPEGWVATKTVESK